MKAVHAVVPNYVWQFLPLYSFRQTWRITVLRVSCGILSLRMLARRNETEAYPFPRMYWKYGCATQATSHLHLVLFANIAEHWCAFCSLWFMNGRRSQRSNHYSYCEFHSFCYPTVLTLFECSSESHHLFWNWIYLYCIYTCLGTYIRTYIVCIHINN